MKLMSWNVNGIRSVHRKGEFLALLDAHQPDVLCIQETKAWPEQLEADLLSDHGYHVVWAQAEKKGYSGVATFSRSAPDRVEVGLGIDRFDREVRERASAADRIEDAIGANMPARPRKRGRS